VSGRRFLINFIDQHHQFFSAISLTHDPTNKAVSLNKILFKQKRIVVIDDDDDDDDDENDDYDDVVVVVVVVCNPFC